MTNKQPQQLSWNFYSRRADSSELARSSALPQPRAPFCTAVIGVQFQKYAKSDRINNESCSVLCL